MRAARVIWAVLAVPSLAFAQGSLTPSAAPAPGMKTLTQIEPRTVITGGTFTITRPGSYYLATNLYVSGAVDGIYIATNDVTIDLNGFELVGSPSGQTGIDSASFLHTVTVRNGMVRNWSVSGIDLGSGANCLVQDIVAISNGYRGIELYLNSRAERCTVAGNDDMGLYTFGPSVLVDCTAKNNGRSGFYLVGDCAVQRCVSTLNGEQGFVAVNGCLLADCVANANQTNGFDIDDGVKLTACVASENYIDGIHAEKGCYIERCSAYLNRRNGITVSNDSVVLENHCSTNGPFGVGAGIYVLGRANRIDGNAANRNDYGIQVVGVSNLVVRNSAQGNTLTNYVITASNSVGGIANVGGAGFTNTNPWVNFEF